jgi:hypothetical protein
VLATTRITQRLASQPRTLHTPLSADECLRRLRDGVYAHPALIKPTTWQEFRADRTIRRKLGNQRFLLWRVLPNQRKNFLWHLVSEIGSQNGITTIRCQYRISRGRLITAAVFSSLFLLYGLYAIAASFNDWSVVVCSRGSGCGPIDPEHEGGFGVLNLVLACMPWWLGRAKDQQDEEHLVQF